MRRDSYDSKREFFDQRTFEFGSVWKVYDRDVSIPQADKLSSRIFHEERWVVVVSNNSQNYHPLCPIITIAPLSSRIDIERHFDLLLSKDKDNVKMDSLLQLQLKQPILKVDLFEAQGKISTESKEELQVLLEDFYGLSYE